MTISLLQLAKSPMPSASVASRSSRNQHLDVRNICTDGGIPQSCEGVL
jgi:hypothetical protein